METFTGKPANSIFYPSSVACLTSWLCTLIGKGGQSQRLRRPVASAPGPEATCKRNEPGKQNSKRTGKQEASHRKTRNRGSASQGKPTSRPRKQTRRVEVCASWDLQDLPGPCATAIKLKLAGFVSICQKERSVPERKASFLATKPGSWAKTASHAPHGLRVSS